MTAATAHAQAAGCLQLLGCVIAAHAPQHMCRGRVVALCCAASCLAGHVKAASLCMHCSARGTLHGCCDCVCWFVKQRCCRMRLCERCMHAQLPRSTCWAISLRAARFRLDGCLAGKFCLRACWVHGPLLRLCAPPNVSRRAEMQARMCLHTARASARGRKCACQRAWAEVRAPTLHLLSGTAAVRVRAQRVAAWRCAVCLHFVSWVWQWMESEQSL